MLNLNFFDGRRTSRDEPQPLLPSPTCAEKIVKIAGIGPGGRVIYLGSALKTMEAAVADAGAVLAAPAGNAGMRFSALQTPADIVLLALAPQRWPEGAGHLRVARRHLRPGGRLVVWAVSGSDCADSVNALGLQQLFHSADFTCIIAGRMVGECSDVVVATGIKVGGNQ